MAYTAVQNRPSTSAPGDGSRTITIQSTQTRPEDDPALHGSPSEGSTLGALRLRGGPRRPRQHVVWSEDVVDNEGHGKKKSKSESGWTSAGA